MKPPNIVHHRCYNYTWPLSTRARSHIHPTSRNCRSKSSAFDTRVLQVHSLLRRRRVVPTKRPQHLLLQQLDCCGSLERRCASRVWCGYWFDCVGVGFVYRRGCGGCWRGAVWITGMTCCVLIVVSSSAAVTVVIITHYLGMLLRLYHKYIVLRLLGLELLEREDNYDLLRSWKIKYTKYI